MSDKSASGVPNRRLRVLVSAYAFGPSDESEASAGWTFARAAAVEHDVWVITRRRFEDGIASALAADPELARHLTVHYLELSDRVLSLKRKPRDVYWYYILWQRRVGELAALLHRQLDFDVVHHLTFASDWLPCGLLKVRDVPVVWGPVGGATYLPFRLSRWVGFRSAAGELCRSMFTRALRRLWGDPVGRRAALVVAQNQEVARRFGYARRVVVEANAALDDPPPTSARTERGPGEYKRAIYVGRLVGWKGGRLAVATLARPAVSDWTLEFFGAGRDESALRALAENLGVADRVIFRGHRPRTEVLAAFADADAMLFPSMHDSAGWVAGEASAAGCPVVCLDRGGPPLLAGANGFPVRISGSVVDDLADALARAGQHRGKPYLRWSRRRLPALLAEWYSDAASSVTAAPSCGR